MNLGELGPPSDLPDAGVVLPGLIARVALAALGFGLTLMMYSTIGFVALGLVICVIAAIAPESRFGWVIMVYLAAAELGHRGGLRWQFLLLLAGVHLLHVLSQFALELPWRSWVQPQVFLAPALRFLAIQIPCQAIAVPAVLVLGENRYGHRPVSVVELGLIGTFALGGLALVLIRGIKDQPSASR